MNLTKYCNQGPSEVYLKIKLKTFPPLFNTGSFSSIDLPNTTIEAKLKRFYKRHKIDFHYSALIKSE